MKKFIIPAIAIMALFASCAKEITSSVDAPKNAVSITATIDNSAAKTDYSINNDGTAAIFHWTGTETIGRLWHTTSPNNFNLDAYTSTTSADNNETSLVFEGPSTVNQTLYAFYPKWGNSKNTGIGWSSKLFRLYLNESMPYDAENPLKDVVPMIGKIDNSGELVFVPVTGVIAVTVSNLPPTATKISLSSNMALSGYYRLSDTPANYANDLDNVMSTGLTTGAAWESENYGGKKSITFSGLGNGEHVFYFPVSVATYPSGSYDDRYNGMTISIYEGESVLMTLTTTKKITVQRGQIVKLPKIDFEQLASIDFYGTASDPYVYVPEFKVNGLKIRYAIAETEEDAITASQSSESIITSAGIGAKVSLSTNLSVSGKYYIGYQVVTSSDYVLLTNSVPFYFLSSEDAAKYTGTYTTDIAISHPGTESNYNNKLVLAVSSSVSDGQLMLTDIFGHPTLGGVSINKPIYGIISGNTLTFAYNGDTYENRFFSKSNNNFHVVQSGSTAAVGATQDIVFSISEANSILSLTNSKYIMIKYQTSNTYTNNGWSKFIYGQNLVFSKNL